MMKKNNLKKQMKYLLWTGVFFVLLGSCSDLGETTSSQVRDHFSDKPKLRGSGKGGIIKVENRSEIPLYVAWSGLGCAGIQEGLTFVCETGKVEPNQDQTYKYNWGVTTTWINIGSELDIDGIHPCSLSAAPVSKKDCLLDHRGVKTKAKKTTECIVVGKKEKSSFRMSCYLDNEKSKQSGKQ